MQKKPYHNRYLDNAKLGAIIAALLGLFYLGKLAWEYMQSNF